MLLPKCLATVCVLIAAAAARPIEAQSGGTLRGRVVADADNAPIGDGAEYRF